MSERQKGRYAVLGVPVPLIFPDRLTDLTAALKAAQRASGALSGNRVRVIRHGKGVRPLEVIGAFEGGEQVSELD